MRYLLLSLFLLTTSTINGFWESSESPCDISFPPAHQFALGPEIYHVKRVREGGTEQSGTLVGVRARFDRIKRYKVYWGADACYAQGTLEGKTGSGAKLRSTFSDTSLEGRLGYTFQVKSQLQPAVTPFVGYGYFREINKFKRPSPIHLKFDTAFHYFAYGFLSSVAIDSQWTVGANFKAMSMWEARCKVTNDPEFDDQSMLIKDKVNYRVELPVDYRFCCACGHFEARVIPFYEYRHYGGRINFPFDFLDTKLRIYGCTLLLGYLF